MGGDQDKVFGTRRPISQAVRLAVWLRPPQGTSYDMSSHPDPGPQTLDRNVNELLQELRVTQTGVQLLSGFLLTVPFTDRFRSLDDLQRGMYVAAFCGSVLATVLLVAPVAFHRLLFRQHQRRLIVEAANWCAIAGLAVLAVTTGGTLFLVLDLVGPRHVAALGASTCLLLFLLVWAVLPLAGAALVRPRDADEEGSSPPRRP